MIFLQKLPFLTHRFFGRPKIWDECEEKIVPGVPQAGLMEKAAGPWEASAQENKIKRRKEQEPAGRLRIELPF